MPPSSGGIAVGHIVLNSSLQLEDTVAESGWFTGGPMLCGSYSR